MKKASFAIITAIGLVALTIWAQPGPLTRINHLAYSVSSPSLVTVTTTAQTVFTANATQDVGRVLVRTIQNTGTVPILYRIGTSDASAAAYHGVIAAGSVAKDGLGSILDLSKVPFPVSLITESSTSVAALVELTQ